MFQMQSKHLILTNNFNGSNLRNKLLQLSKKKSSCFYKHMASSWIKMPLMFTNKWLCSWQTNDSNIYKQISLKLTNKWFQYLQTCSAVDKQAALIRLNCLKSESTVIKFNPEKQIQCNPKEIGLSAQPVNQHSTVHQNMKRKPNLS